LNSDEKLICVLKQSFNLQNYSTVIWEEQFCHLDHESIESWVSFELETEWWDSVRSMLC